MDIVVVETAEVLDQDGLDEFRVADQEHGLAELEHSAVFVAIQPPARAMWQLTAQSSANAIIRP
jgi:hypothetical protein